MPSRVRIADDSANIVSGDQGTSYADARAGTDVLRVTTVNLDIGQTKTALPTFFCYNTLISFDTSFLGSSAVIISAVLSLYFDDEQAGQDFTIEAREHDFGDTITTADFVAGADISGKTLVASMLRSAATLNQYNALTSDAALLTNINKTGKTRIVVTSSRFRTGDEPAGFTERITAQMFSAANPPKLTITYISSGGGQLWIEGDNLHYIDASGVEHIVSIPPIPATDVEVSELGSATYDDVQDYINFFGDRTLLTGGTITDNGDGTAAVAALTGWCKETDSNTAVGVFFDFASPGNTPALTDLVTNYVYIDYNGGTPQIVVSTAILTHGRKQDHIHIATIFRNGTTLHFHEENTIGISRANAVNFHWLEEFAAHRVSGLVTSDGGSLALSITAGVLYEGSSRHPTVVDGSTWSTWYYNFNTSAWVEVTGQSAIDNANYNPTGSGTGLANLTANRYAVHWVYVDIDGADLHIVYGQGDYKANEAEEAGVPALLPDQVIHYGVLIAKIIVQDGQTALTITYPWTSAFTSSLATDHGNLAGLLDDDHPQYGLKKSKSITIENPTDSEDITMFFTEKAITITEIRAVVRGTTPSLTWTIRHGTDRSAAGAEVVTSGTTTTSESTGSDVTSFNDATIIADSFVWLETTAESGTTDEAAITIVYTVD